MMFISFTCLKETNQRKGPTLDRHFSAWAENLSVKHRVNTFLNLGVLPIYAYEGVVFLFMVIV